MAKRRTIIFKRVVAVIATMCILLSLLPTALFTSLAAPSWKGKLYNIYIVGGYSQINLTPGQTKDLEIGYVPIWASDKTVTWTSSNKSVATVDANGVITAVSVGTATITVKSRSGGHTDSCKVVVSVPVTGITLNTASVKLALGTTYSLTAAIAPSNATNKAVMWSSNNSSVASVSSTGVITAKSAGTCAISALTADGGKMATCVVTVYIPATSVKISQTTASLEVNDSIVLSASVVPSTATDNSIIWSSSAPSVASVLPDGTVIGRAAGTAVITARSVDGKSATCTVTVKSVISEVHINKSATSLVQGESEQLTATVLPSSALDKTVTWSSSDPAIVSVSSTGCITALKVGSATVSATSVNGVVGSCSVYVTSATVAVKGISLSESEISISESGVYKLNSVLTPSDATNTAVTWSSSDSNVADVASDGTVFAIAAGTAIITATTEDGNFSASCVVNVKVNVTGVVLSSESISLNVGSSKKLDATVIPSNAADKTLVWRSGDTSVAEVDADGNVTAKKVGTTYITAVTVDGGYYATCSVNVVSSVTGITLNTDKLTVSRGGVYYLSASVYPSDATYSALQWSSSDESVATVVDGFVTAHSAGTAKITVTTAEGGFSASCDISVVVYVTGVSISDPIYWLPLGETHTLTVGFLPEDASNRNVIWSSSDTSVVKVENGVISGVALGEAIVTATTEDGGKKAYCQVTVIAPVTGVSLNKTELTLTEGTKETLVATVMPENAEDKTVTWYSDDTDVVYVAADGTVSARGEGTATVTVVTNNGYFTATCEVTVLKADTSVAVSGVSLSHTKLSLDIGETYNVYAFISPSDATNTLVAWTSSDDNVASVVEGKVEAISEGTAVITVTTLDGAYEASCTVNVSVPEVSVTGVELEYTELTVELGESMVLSCNVLPSDATNKEVMWWSDDEDVAYVEDDGTLVTVGVGTCVLTVDTLDGRYTKDVTLVVTPPYVAAAGVELDVDSATVGVGEELQLCATVLPADATNKNVGWYISDGTVIESIGDGKFVALKEGYAVITVETEDGSFSDVCAVTVTKAEVKVTGVTVTPQITLAVGATGTLEASVLPADATNTELTWSSDNEGVATVSNGVVVAKAVGTAVITVTTVDGAFEATSIVTVTEPLVSVTGVSFDESSADIEQGESLTLGYAVYPANASNKKVSWYSSDPSVASVSDGIVTAVKEGTAIIAVTTEDGSFTATCQITVQKTYVKPTLETVVYTVNDDENTVTGIKENITADAFLDNINNSETVKLYYNGKELSANDCVGTGAVVEIIENGVPANSYVVVVRGDNDGNGVVNVTDLIRLRCTLLGVLEMNEAEMRASDITEGLGNVDGADWTLLKRHLIKTYDLFA